MYALWAQEYTLVPIWREWPFLQPCLWTALPLTQESVNAVQHLTTYCCLCSVLIEYLRKNMNRISYPFVCEGQTPEHGAPKVGFRPSLRSVPVGSSVSTQGRALPLPNEFHPESCSRSPLDESQHFLPLADPWKRFFSFMIITRWDFWSLSFSLTYF